MLALTDHQRDLAARHVWLARRIAAQRFAKHHGEVDFDDLFSDAQLGLLTAAARFDPRKGARFSTFAAYAINGAISDGRRARDHVTRYDRKLATDVSRIHGRFTKTHGRLATEQEVAAELKMTAPELNRRIALVRSAPTVSLDTEVLSRFASGNTLTPADLVADPRAQDELDAIHVRCLPDGALDRLLPRERMVVGLYFWQELTMREIAEDLGVTESRVSQIIGRALQRLRAIVPAELAEAA